MVIPFNGLWLYFLFIAVCILLIVIAAVLIIVNLTAYIYPVSLLILFMLNLLTAHNLKLSAPSKYFLILDLKIILYLQYCVYLCQI
jgi:hypothetical protein